MYKIIGADGREYGPVTPEQIRQWLAEGRANAQSKVQPEGATGWQALADCAEFAGTRKGRASVAGPPPVSGALVTEAKTSGLAIASLVLGICGLFTCGLSALVGLVLGLVAMSQIKKSQGRVGGHGLALAGTIVSGVFFLLLPFYLALFLPALARAKSKAQTVTCVSNLKQLGLAVKIYAVDHNDQFPAATNCCDAVLTHVGAANVFQCPRGDPGPRSHYAFNAKLAGAVDGQVAPDTVVVFEAEGGWNLSGGRGLMIQKPRHGRTFTVALADGSVRQVTPAQLDSLRWDP